MKDKPFKEKLGNVSILMTKFQKLSKIFQNFFKKICSIFVKSTPLQQKNAQVRTFSRSFVLSEIYLSVKFVLKQGGSTSK